MEKKFVCDYEDCQILEIYDSNLYFNLFTGYKSFEEAKKAMIAYWQAGVNEAKRKLKEANKLKQ